MATIGIDLDGVCYDFTAALCDFLGRDVPESPTWDFYKEWGWDREKFLQACRDAIEKGTLFGYGYLIPGAKEGVHALLDAGHKIVFITARGGFSGGKTFRERTQERTLHWLRTEMGVPNPNVVFEGRKVGAALKAGTDFFLEDNAHNVAALLDAEVEAYLFDQPWNRDVDLPRLTAWSQFVWVVNMGLRITDRAAVTQEVRVISSTGGEKGKKLARFDLIPKKALWKVAELYGKGAEKYDDHNWRRGYPYSLSQAALERHYALWVEGQDYDDETGCHHLAAVIFHALSLITFEEEHPEMDDRFCAQQNEEDVA